ncbi:MAG: hypothetical protein ABW061_13730 [Polyangiaceae bacterium]
MRIDRARFAWCCAVAVALCFVAGCPGKLEDKQRFLDYVPAEAGPEAAAPLEAGPGAEAGGPNDGPCGDIIDRVFAPSCGDSGCHGAVAPQQGLDLVSPGLAERVVGVAGTACVSTLADPTNPESSLIYTKLLPTPGCGAQMPLARPALSAEDTACVLAWIAAQ